MADTCRETSWTPRGGGGPVEIAANLVTAVLVEGQSVRAVAKRPCGVAPGCLATSHRVGGKYDPLSTPAVLRGQVTLRAA